jgi:hypothetical protein
LDERTFQPLVGTRRAKRPTAERKRAATPPPVIVVVVVEACCLLRAAVFAEKVGDEVVRGARAGAPAIDRSIARSGRRG